LSRSFVAENQRERILAAVADVVSAASYGELTVEGIIVTAGISRRTFYEHFNNKDEAFLAAYDAITAQLVAEVLPAVDAADGFAARVAAGLGTFLDFLAGEAAFARMCIVEVLAAGPDAIRRRNDTMRSFADLIDRNAQELLAGKVAPGLTAELIVGGIYEVVYTRVLRGEIHDLPALLPDLTYSALLPYLGPEAAAAERHRLLDSPQAA
jgi:AcrR family transcriptional regulator